MSDKRTVVMVTVILDTQDFPTIERLARDFRALYTDAHHGTPGLVQGGYVIATEMPADAARGLELRLTQMSLDSAAMGAPVECSDPETARLCEVARRARRQ